jgi:hypothetical protein
MDFVENMAGSGVMRKPTRYQIRPIFILGIVATFIDEPSDDRVTLFTVTYGGLVSSGLCP